MVECNLAKVDVAGSNPVSRSGIIKVYNEVGVMGFRHKALADPPRILAGESHLPLWNYKVASNE